METAERKRKADDGWHDKENNKKARIECLDPLAIVLLSLTSRNWLNFVRMIPNKIWHAIYLATRQRFEMNIDGTTLDKLLKSAHGFAGPYHTTIFEWDFEVWDHPLTTDCLDVQKDLTAEDEHLAQFPAQYFADESTYSRSMGVKEVNHERYDETIDYKRLALKTELKFHQFELWKDIKPTNEAVRNENCSCMKEPTELALYDANDQELSIRSNLDLHLGEDHFFSTGTPVAKQKEFKYGWDNESVSDQEDDTSVANQADTNLPSNASNTNVSANDIKMELVEKHDEKLDLENEKEQSKSGDSGESENIEYDGYISVEKRDQLLEDIAAAPEHALKSFIHVLSAIILGHCPAPSCHDSALITTAKYEHTIVRTGDVLDEVINQIKHGVTLNLADTISTMTCALQKLRMTDLLFLKKGTEEKYPYLTAVYSVLEVEENIPLPFYIGDANWAFNLDDSVVNPLTSYFQADFATDEDFEAMPDWLSVRHSVHRLMRKAGTTCATPNTTEFAVLTLCDYIRKTLSAIVADNSEEDSIDVTSRDVLKAVEKAAGPHRLARAYTYNIDYYDESPIILNSDSEAYSCESSSDSDWVDEPINDLDEDSVVSVDEEDVQTDDPLHSIVQESLKKCAVHAQCDAKEDSEHDIGEDSSDNDDESVEERIQRAMVDYWDTVTDNAPGNDDKTAYYMPKILTEEAMHYTAQELSEHDQMAKLFIENYEDDVPFHDMPADQRQKMLELRRQTNQMIKDQCEEEFNQEVKTKYDRMNFNIDNCDLSIRSDADQCRTMIIDLINHKTMEHTIQTAAQIIRSSAALKSIKIMNVDCTIEGTEDLIAQLFGAIAACPSISSLVIFGCQFKSFAALTDLLRKKSFTKFHMMFPVGFKDSNIEYEDEFLNALKNQQSLKDLMLPIGNADESKKKYLDAISVLVSQLANLHIWYLDTESFNNLAHVLTDLLKQPHQLELVIHVFPYIFRYGPQLAEPIMDKLNVNYRIHQH